MERRHVVVRGFVQGVGFRYAVERAARSRGVAGWIRNNPDGTVEAVFEGEQEDVESLVDFCRRGPRSAQVDHVEVAIERHTSLSGFLVR
jgi:acylphosphatase